MENKNIGIFTAYSDGTRPLNELYQLVLDNFDNFTIYGICNKIADLRYFEIISVKEYHILIKNFKQNKPTIFSKFWWNISFNAFKNYWWTLNNKGDEQRKLFLQHLIKKYS